MGILAVFGVKGHPSIIVRFVALLIHTGFVGERTVTHHLKQVHLCLWSSNHTLPFTVDSLGAAPPRPLTSCGSDR